MDDNQSFFSDSAKLHSNFLASIATEEHRRASVFNTTVHTHNSDTNISYTNNTDPGTIVDDINITSSDVTGRGKGAQAREGNAFYSSLIRQYKTEYQNAVDPKLKRGIVQRVLDIIKNQEPKGRFMKRVEGQHQQVWIVQDDDFAWKKISQALQEKPRVSPPQENIPIITASDNSESKEVVEGNGISSQNRLDFPNWMENVSSFGNRKFI